MKLITLFYIINASLLILHEIESAYEKEWEILKLPGKITGFLIMHIPILIFIFYGLVEIDKLTASGLITGIIFGAGGAVPFLVHKVFIKRKERFNSFISNFIIYLNVISGLTLLILSLLYIARPQ